MRFFFFEYCRSRHTTTGDETPISINDFLEDGWEIETQKGNPEINTNWLLSVLITDSQLKASGSGVQSSERNAGYDGIITFGNKLTMVIEVKPRSENVWTGQLNPSRHNRSEDTKVYSNFIGLEWGEIIKQLNHLLELSTMAGNERMMIEDFLSFVDENFPHPNPYDSFHQCKGNAELISRGHNVATIPLTAKLSPANMGVVRAPAFCDESGVGFAAQLAENSTPLWSHQSILRSDETWLPEWSGNLGGVQRWRSSVAWGVLGWRTLFRRVEIARPLRKTYGSTAALREWKVWTWPRFASATLSSAFERR
jgi:hypothetical protein